MNRNDGARGDARKRALSIPEGPGRWLTDDELARVIADAKAEALRDLRLKCPQHGIPDCSPLLNGCRYPEYLRNQLDETTR